ncbi:MAG: hypothetical protein Q8R38_07780 [Candidatus Omnitrophota bacterium]|nr:hypothetical protein [Candidatus Omnitrophota bacterium]
MRSKIFTIFIILLVAITVIYLSLDKIAIFALSKIYKLNISYKSMTKDARDGYIFENLKMVNDKMGLGFFCARATIKPVQKLNFLKSLDFDFKFKDAHFIKSSKDKPKAQYDTLEGIVAMPFEGRWTYKDISGVVEIFSNGFTLKKFQANGREIKLFISGDIFYQGVVDVNITASFSKDTLKDVPMELHSVIMNDEPQEWKSLSVKLKGDYRSPSVQISGKMFRLNVGTMVMKE